jgi:hypothetical protein
MLFTSSIAKALLLCVMSPVSRSRLILTGQRAAGEAHPLLPPDRNLGDKQLDRLRPVEIALLLECFHVFYYSLQSKQVRGMFCICRGGPRMA